MGLARRIFFGLAYLLGKAPWDTGVTPPELVNMVENWGKEPGYALDIGCGTGTNCVYLAKKGWKVVGIDFSKRALIKAMSKVNSENLNGRVELIQGDACKLGQILAGRSFDLMFDIGCFHSLSLSEMKRYVAGLATIAKPGSKYMLYAFLKKEGQSVGPAGVDYKLVDELFSPYFELLEVAKGSDAMGFRESSWFIMQKRS